MKFHAKIILIIILLVILTSGVVIATKPVLHKQLQFEVVDYILKFNTDGSTDVTKKTTIHQVKGK